MEKLMKLLYEYQKIKCFYPLYYDAEENKIYLDSDARIWAEQYLISKDFWFIKWLVKNDKIDLEGIEQRAIDFFYDESPVRWKEIRTERLIMMLSIQDNPIEDLISFLK